MWTSTCLRSSICSCLCLCLCLCLHFRHLWWMNLPRHLMGVFLLSFSPTFLSFLMYIYEVIVVLCNTACSYCQFAVDFGVRSSVCPPSSTKKIKALFVVLKLANTPTNPYHFLLYLLPPLSLIPHSLLYCPLSTLITPHLLLHLSLVKSRCFLLFSRGTQNQSNAPWNPASSVPFTASFKQKDKEQVNQGRRLSIHTID